MKQQKTALLFALILTFAFSVLAQEIPPPPPPPQNTVVDTDEIVKVNSRLVVVPVSVLDANGEPVLNLTAQDFSVEEENKQQEIAQVSKAGDVPLEIALLFDISATTTPMFRFEQETAAKFLKEIMRPEDRATIFTIGENPVLVQARGSAAKSSISIKEIQPTKQFTAFYDTVRIAAEYLEKNTPQGRRKVVLIISDGEDTNSNAIAKALQSGYASLGKQINTLDRKTLYEYTVKKSVEANVKERGRVLKSLQNSDTVFYSINPAGSSYKLNKISRVGQLNMQTFADQTGGTAFLPKFLPIDTKNQYQNEMNMIQNTTALEDIFKQLTNELRAQYLLQYYSESEYPASKFITLNVALKSPGNYRLRARQGYFVKN